MKIKNREELIAKQEEYRASLNSQRKQILICAGTGCVAGGSLEIYAKMKDIIEGKGLKCALVLEKDPHGDSIGLKKSGCHGFCEMGPLLRIEPMGWLYIKVSLDDCEEIIEKSIIGDEVIDRLVYKDQDRQYKASERLREGRGPHMCGPYDAACRSVGADSISARGGVKTPPYKASEKGML